MIDEKFKNLNQSVYKGKRAPHKPLLILLALSYYQNGHDRLINYRDIDDKMRSLFLKK